MFVWFTIPTASNHSEGVRDVVTVRSIHVCWYCEYIQPYPSVASLPIAWQHVIRAKEIPCRPDTGLQMYDRPVARLLDGQHIDSL